MNDRHKPEAVDSPAANPEPGKERLRRDGGARQTVSEPVVFHGGNTPVTGWALNMSRGGLRAIVEMPLEEGAEYQIAVGDAETHRPGRIVWVQQERDGAIVGVSFLDVARPSDPPRSSDWPAQPDDE